MKEILDAQNIVSNKKLSSSSDIRVWGVIRVKIQFSCSVVLLCYFVVLL